MPSTHIWICFFFRVSFRDPLYLRRDVSVSWRKKIESAAEPDASISKARNVERDDSTGVSFVNKRSLFVLHQPRIKSKANIYYFLKISKTKKKERSRAVYFEFFSIPNKDGMRREYRQESGGQAIAIRVARFCGLCEYIVYCIIAFWMIRSM